MERRISEVVWGRSSLGAALIALIALMDWRVQADVAFGFLYVFPMFLLGMAWSPWRLLVAAALCTTLADVFDPYPFVAALSVPHDILVFVSLAGTGLYAHAVTQSRRLAREAEEQFEFLVNTSPAAILTMAGDGTILLANAAAHRVLRAAPDTLPGQPIRRYLPALAQIPSRAQQAVPLQSTLQCRGARETGDGFLADVFFSAYRTASGLRVAAVIIDISEDVRERELSGLDQLLTGSRLLVGALFHEVRNLSSALSITTETLGRNKQLTGNRDFDALQTLVRAMTDLASAGLVRSATDTDAAAIAVSDLVADLRLVLDSYCEEGEIGMEWEVPADLPRVWADRHRLLQVVLNLVRNSERALEASPVKRIDVRVSVHDDRVLVRVTDTGPGPAIPEHLFEPFQEAAHSSGLGLYLSRALVRSFGGDLRYDPAPEDAGCSFVIALRAVRSGTSPQAESNVAHSPVAR